MQRLYKSLKAERDYQLYYKMRDEARVDIANWVEGFYNGKRLHWSVGYRSLVQVECGVKAA